MRKCVYCKYCYIKGSKISFHKFPTNIKTKSIWLLNMKAYDWTPKANDSLCSRHFEQKCFIAYTTRSALKIGSVPTIFEGNFVVPDTDFPENIEPAVSDIDSDYDTNDYETRQEVPESRERRMEDLDMSTFNEVLEEGYEFFVVNNDNNDISTGSELNDSDTDTYENEMSNEGNQMSALNETDEESDDISAKNDFHESNYEISEKNQINEYGEESADTEMYENNKTHAVEEAEEHTDLLIPLKYIDYDISPKAKFKGISKISLRRIQKPKQHTVLTNLRSTVVMNQNEQEGNDYDTKNNTKTHCSVSHDHLYENTISSKKKAAERAKQSLKTTMQSLKSSKARIRSLSTQINKLRMQVASQKKIIKELSNRKNTSEDFMPLLETCNDFQIELFSRFLRSKTNENHSDKYPPQLRAFAITLHFYSPKAYAYVRKKLNSVLPHPRVIRSWCSNANKDPSFLEESFKYSLA